MNPWMVLISSPFFVLSFSTQKRFCFTPSCLIIPLLPVQVRICEQATNSAKDQGGGNEIAAESGSQICFIRIFSLFLLICKVSTMDSQTTWRMFSSLDLDSHHPHCRHMWTLHDFAMCFSARIFQVFHLRTHNWDPAPCLYETTLMSCTSASYDVISQTSWPCRNRHAMVFGASKHQ